MCQANAGERVAPAARSVRGKLRAGSADAVQADDMRPGYLNYAQLTSFFMRAQTAPRPATPEQLAATYSLDVTTARNLLQHFRLTSE